jgi:hypothetical protein
MISHLELDGRNVPDWLEQSSGVEPGHPVQCRELDVVHAAPRTATTNDLGLVQPDDCLGHRVVVGVTDAPHRRLDPSFGQSLGVANREVLFAGSVPSFVEKEKRRNLLLTKQIAQRGEGGLRREEGYHD